MAKNETPALIVSLLVTAGVLGGGFWWFTHRSGVELVQPTVSPTSNAAPTPATSDFAQVQNVPTGLFSYGGSTTWAAIRLAIGAQIQSARPEFRLRYVDPSGSSPSSTTGIRMLLDGQLAFSQSSRPISDAEYQQAQQRGFTLKQIPVAIDGLAIAVNPSLNISGLTIEQLKGIYTGQITNWSQVGGPNESIKAFSRDAKSGGTVQFFVEQVLGGQSLGPTVQIVATTTQALQKLGASPGGIYFASAPEVVPQCTIKPIAIGRTLDKFVNPYRDPLIVQCAGGQRNQVNEQAFQSGDYPLTRNLFVVVKQNGQSEQQAGEAYANLLLSNQGQTAIENAGFVRIR